jgi:putative ABC transport system permease protein
MFKNFIRVGLRSLWKNKIFSFINIFGLAASMSICLLIMLMLADQSEYDQFHADKERIYRILSDRGQTKKTNKYATSPLATAKALKDEYPIIEKSTGIHMGVGGDATYQQKTMTMRGFFADQEFFDIFSFDLTIGNRQMALTEPRSMVVTADFAKKLFGNADPVGKTVTFDNRGLPHLDIGGIDNPPVSWGEFTITGVLDLSSNKSHLKFDVLVSNTTLPSLVAESKIEDRSNDWKYYYNTYTFVKLQDGKTEEDLQVALNDLVSRKYEGMEDLREFSFTPQKLTEITPGKFLNNMASFRLPIEAYYFLSFLALVIMVSACLNYTNLSVARSLTRSKEIGIRKVTGAVRKHLVWQFLGESVLTSLLALVLAVLLLNIMKPAFMSLWINKYLNFNLSENIQVFIRFFVFAVLIGVIAGIVPALHLSRFKPVLVLKSNFGSRAGKIGFRKILTVSQFVVSLFFIVTTILIIRQTRHYIHFEYGFSTENIINVQLQGNDFDVVAAEFGSVTGVSNVSACQHLPATGISTSSGLRLQRSEEEFIDMGSFYVHPNFIDNLKLEIISGSNFNEYNKSSTERSVIINETAVEKLGFSSPDDATGKIVEIKGLEYDVTIGGVVRNFQFRLPMEEEGIQPMVFRNGPGHFSYVNLKVNSDNLTGLVAELEEKWGKIDPVHSFEYSFFDEQMANNYQILTDVISVIGFFAFISISIACLGLLGIATYSVERRIREVGIRKVLGAGEYTLALLLSKSFIKMLLLSILIASPLVYFANNMWLQEFSNRIEYGFGTIFSGAMIMLLLGVLTIGSQTIRISRTNPADTLRME